MRSIGLPELFISLVFPGLIVFCLWKFYRILSKINDNITGIRQALERNVPTS